MTKLKGLSAYVFKTRYDKRFAYDTTNRGITHYADQVTVVDERVGEVFDASFDRPPVMVKEKVGGYKCAVPVFPLDMPLRERLHRRMWFMAGGNYIKTSDSRFSKINQYPIPVHDRVESHHYPYLLMLIWDLSTRWKSMEDRLDEGGYHYVPGSIKKNATKQMRWFKRLFLWYVRHGDGEKLKGVAPLIEAVMNVWRNDVSPMEHRVTHIDKYLISDVSRVEITDNNRQTYNGYGRGIKEAYRSAYRSMRINRDSEIGA